MCKVVKRTEISQRGSIILSITPRKYAETLHPVISEMQYISAFSLGVSKQMYKTVGCICCINSPFSRHKPLFMPCFTYLLIAFSPDHQQHQPSPQSTQDIGVISDLKMGKPEKQMRLRKQTRNGCLNSQSSVPIRAAHVLDLRKEERAVHYLDTHLLTAPLRRSAFSVSVARSVSHCSGVLLESGSGKGGLSKSPFRKTLQ